MWTEDERLAALYRQDILDSEPEAVFDDLVALTRAICRTPIALVSLVDTNRQWFKARTGVDICETDIDTSVCALAIQQDGLFVIEDLTADPRTAAMSLVTAEGGIRFYAGVPLVTAQGMPLGSLCAIDTVARPGGLTASQGAALTALAAQVAAQIDLRTALGDHDRLMIEQRLREGRAARDAEMLDTMLAAQQLVLESGGDADSALDALVNAALAAVEPADGVAVEVRQDDELVYTATAGSAATRVGLRVPVTGSFSGLALAERRTLITADAWIDPRADRETVRALGIRSMIVVPLVRQGEVFGALKISSTDPDAFRSRHMLVTQMLGGLIAASFSESAERAAIRSATLAEANYRTIVDSATDSAIFSMDDAGYIRSWSTGGERIFGWSEAEMIGRPFATIFTPEDAAAGRPDEALATAREHGGAAHERWHVRKDGTRFYAQGAVTPLVGEGRSGFVKSLRDVTADHLTRQALDASRVRLDTALETGLIAFFSWDVAAGLLSGDPRLASFFDYPVDAMADGLAMADILARVEAEDRGGLIANVQRAVRALDDYSQWFRIRGDDGKLRWLVTRGRCTESADGRALHYVGTVVDMTEQRAIEDELRSSRERLELATRAARLGSFDYLPDSGRLTWDDRCRELFGVSPGVPVTYDTHFVPALHPDDRATTEAAVAAALDPAGSGVFEVDYRAIGIEDGVERIIAAEGLALFADGRATRLIGTVRDVTADRRARAALKETEERLRYAVAATNDAIWDWDLRIDSVHWNDALEKSYGHALSTVEPTGAWWIEQIHPDDRSRIHDSIHTLIDGTATDWLEEYRFRRADGGYADVLDRGFVLRDGDGRPMRMIGAMLDLTDRKRMERALESRAERLEQDFATTAAERDLLWEASPDLLVVLDLSGAIQQVNPAWATILGYAPEALIGRRLVDLAHPEDRPVMAQAIADAAGGPIDTIRNRYAHASDGWRWMAWVAGPARNRIYATGRHVTAEKEAEETLRQTEEALRQSQKVEAVGQLTGGVAHDFNNLLTVIQGSVDLLKRPGLSDDRRRRYIDAIADTTERATRLTAQLLAFARRQALQPQVFDASDSVAALGDMLRTLSGSRIRLSLDHCQRCCFVNADPSQFDTAIVNMAVNARDAMDGEGALTISVAPADHMPSVRNHPRIDGAMVRIAIRDTGSGIPADKIDHIFEPFFTTKAVGHGTGLGLSQVFGFAKQSNGGVIVESVVGEGTTFTLYLPRVDADSGTCRATGEADGHRLPPGSCVLVVEDNAEVGRFATQALAELGYESVWAPNADAALDRLTADGSRFAVVFTDVVMPGRSGIELAEATRERWPDMPIVLTSGYSHVLAQHGTGGYVLLQKPYSLEQLARALGQVSRNLVG